MEKLGPDLYREERMKERLQKINRYLQEPEPKCMGKADLQKLQEVGSYYSTLRAYVECKWTGEPFHFSGAIYIREIDKRFEKILNFRHDARKIITGAVKIIEAGKVTKGGGYLDILSLSETMPALEKRFEEYERNREYVKVYDPQFNLLGQLLEAGKSYANLVYNRSGNSQCVYCGQEQEGFHLFGGLDEGWFKHKGLLACNKENKWRRSASIPESISLEKINAAYTFFQKN